MMNCHNVSVGPAAQFVSEGMAGCDRAIGPADGLFSEESFDSRIQPKPIITPAANIAREVLRRVKRISGQKNLRDGRVSHSKISSRDQHVGAAATDEPGQIELFLQKTFAGVLGCFHLDKRKIGKRAEFIPQGWAERHRSVQIRPASKMRNQVANIGNAAPRASSQTIKEQVHHRAGTVASNLCSHCCERHEMGCGI